jgi:hypothetical protein
MIPAGWRCVSRAGEVELLDGGFVKPGFGGFQLSHALSFQFEAVCPVNQPVQHGVGDGGIADLPGVRVVPGECHGLAIPGLLENAHIVLVPSWSILVTFYRNVAASRRCRDDRDDRDDGDVDAAARSAVDARPLASPRQVIVF